MADSHRKQLETLFNDIVLDENEIDFITSLDQDGEVLVSSTEYDRNRPDAKVLCESAGDVAASLSGISELQKVLVRFEKESKRGKLEYTVFQLNNGILLTYFLDSGGKTDTVAVVSSTKTGLGLMRRTIDRKIGKIEGLIAQL
jgi:hypothetical protein